MKKYLILLIAISALLQTGCGTMDDKKPVRNHTVRIERQDATDRKLKEMKRKGYDGISLGNLGKIIEKDHELLIETDYNYHPVPDQYKDVVAPGDEVWIVYSDAKVSSYDNDTVTFTHKDIQLCKVVTSEELLEQYDCQKRNTYYATYVFKGEGTVYDNRYAPAIGYYVESMDFSFLENRLYSYNYLDQVYLSTYWSSSEEDDELKDIRRLYEISGTGIEGYIESFNEYGIVY